MIVLALLLAVNADALKPCEQRLPSEVQALVAKQYPAFRYPTLGDYEASDIDDHRHEHAGDSCIYLASADVDGDQRNDFAFLITREAGPTKFIVARHANYAWTLEELFEPSNGTAGCCYVEIVPKGRWENVYGQPPSEPGEVQVFRNTLPGFETGHLGSTEIAFFRHKHHWVHVWLGD